MRRARISRPFTLRELSQEELHEFDPEMHIIDQ